MFGVRQGKAALGLLLWGLSVTAQAAIPPTLYDPANCTANTTAPKAYVFCDDGLPPTGGTTPNVGGVAAITVPARYGAVSDVDNYTGLPLKAADAGAMAGADTNGDIALDVDITLPSTPPPPGGYPLMLFNHGCCSGNKTSWEGDELHLVGGPKEMRWRYNNAWFASRGYVVVNYTSRGFASNGPVNNPLNPRRGSTGEMQLLSRAFEINDMQHLACQVQANAANWTGVSGAGGGQSVVINPQKIVITGGSYSGGFTWLSLADPEWTCTADTGSTAAMRIVVGAPRYGWTDLVQSLVPTGTHLQDDGIIIDTNGCDSGPKRKDGSNCDAGSGDPITPIGLPTKSTVSGLFATGLLGSTFPSKIFDLFSCVQGSYPLENNPQCTVGPQGNDSINTSLPELLRDNSPYYQDALFARIANPAAWHPPIFSVGTLTDTLFPPVEHKRMHNRILSIDPDYPLQAYFGDFQHFVQNKAKEWADLCGADRHICIDSDYPGFDFNADPPTLVRRGVHSRLNDFIDHYAQPASNSSQPAPSFDVSVGLTVCPDTAAAAGIPADESGDQFTASSFDALTDTTVVYDSVNPDFTAVRNATTSSVSGNSHAVNSDPIANDQGPNAGSCVVETGAAEPGVAVYDTDILTEDLTMIGPALIHAEFTPAGDVSALQLNARLYDVFPSGRAVLVDRGPRRLTAAEVAAGVVDYQIMGNAYRFQSGNFLRLELAQDDQPFVSRSDPPSSLTLNRVSMRLPARSAGGGGGGGGVGSTGDDDDDGDRPALGGGGSGGVGPWAIGLLILLALGAVVRRR